MNRSLRSLVAVLVLVVLLGVAGMNGRRAQERAANGGRAATIAESTTDAVGPKLPVGWSKAAKGAYISPRGKRLGPDVFVQRGRAVPAMASHADLMRMLPLVQRQAIASYGVTPKGKHASVRSRLVILRGGHESILTTVNYGPGWAARYIYVMPSPTHLYVVDVSMVGTPPAVIRTGLDKVLGSIADRVR